mgnify:CR=1 FL=1
MADRQTDDFKLGTKAADMWLYTAAACANAKVIPKKYRYTTGGRGHPAASWSKAVLTVRYMCAAWYEKDRSRAAQAREDVRRR